MPYYPDSCGTILMMMSRGQKIDDFLSKELWEKDLSALGTFRALQIKLLRIAHVVIKGFTEEQLALRAMGLVYTTLLSLVPLLAVSFSVLKAFGVHTQLVIFLYYFLEPLGPKGVDISLKIIEFVENVNGGVLGSIGLSMLVYTVLSTVQKIESALNYIWHIKGTRDFSQRFTNYMSVLLVGPILVFSALGITATFMSSTMMKRLLSIEILGALFYLIARLVPYVLISIAFTLIYVFLPNLKVRFKSALVGGVTAAILWQTTGWIFTSFIASSAQYSAIYSGFATLVLFLIWLYWSFLILLVGAKVSYVAQHPRSSIISGKPLTSSTFGKERLAMLIMFLIGNSFYYNDRRWKLDSLTERLGLPSEVVHDTVHALEAKGLILPSGDTPPVYLPASDLENISLKEVLDSVRGSGEGIDLLSGKALSIPEVDRIMGTIEDAITGSLHQETIKSIILSTKEAR
jgi:membrane protein